MFLITLCIILAVVLFVMAKVYNGLRETAEGVKREQSNLLGQLKKRATLVNQLIDVCKGYGDHEKLTHLTISAALQEEGDAAKIARASSSVLAGVNLVADRFPELKANETYRTLMAQLENVERELQAQRERMNAAVATYNTRRGRFPTVLFANALGYPEAPYFSTDDLALEEGHMFRTDDGQMLREHFNRIGRGAAEKTRAIGNRAGDALRSAQAQLDKTAADSTPADKPAPSAGPAAPIE